MAEETTKIANVNNGGRTRLLLCLMFCVLLLKDVFLKTNSYLEAPSEPLFTQEVIPSSNSNNSTSTVIKEVIKVVEVEASTKPPETLCELLQTRSPMQLWMDNLSAIHAAGKMPLDRNFKLHDMTAHVLQLLTPRLPMGQRSMPRQGVSTVLEKLQARWDYLTNKESTTTNTATEIPPLRIVVMGGSVTMGVNCKGGIRFYDNMNCAWAGRLQHLINTLAGGIEMVEIVNLSTGGSNTATGTALLEFDLVPEHARNPDVIINAYSTNDMHVLTMRDAANSNLTLRDKTFSMAQGFARQVLGMCPEKRPLLLWMDDYLGNEQRGILQTTELSQGLQVLANYYGFGFMSYADTVRDWVYGTTNETSFSPALWYRTNKVGMQREIHPGASTHLAISYVVAFYMLQMASATCSVPWDSGPTHFIGGHGLPELKQGKSLEGPPRPTPDALPPPLEPDLQLDHVTELWENASSTKDESKCLHAEKTRCPVSWVSGVSLAREPEDVFKYFEPYIVQPAGWGYRDDRKVAKAKKKYGFSPNVTGDILALKFDLDQDISTLAVFFMKSYGEKWENSACKITIVETGTVVTSREIHGSHDKETSENYSETVQFPKALRKFEVRFEHTAGQTFKLMGMAVCS